MQLGLRTGGEPAEEAGYGGGAAHAPRSYPSGERALLYGGGLLPPERRWLRPAAAGIDLLVLAGGPLLAATAIVFVTLLFSPDAEGLPAVFRIAQALALALFLLRDAPAGGSPGKRLLGLRVIRVDGRPSGPRESVLRNLPVLAPVWNLYELRAISVRPDGRRPGDLLAGTAVLEG